MQSKIKTSLPLILGSSSRWRKELLENAGFKFMVMHPNIDEKGIRNQNPEKLALSIAHAKSVVLLPQIKEPSILITTDQVVYCHGEIFEKPVTAEEVYYFYDCYAQHFCETITAVVVTNTETRQFSEGVDIAKVYHKPIPKEVAKKYIQKGHIFHCAGGFQIEDENGDMDPYIDHIEGTVDSVKGLPLKLVIKLIRAVDGNTLYSRKFK